MKNTGAAYAGNGSCRFQVWAPEKKTMLLHLVHPVDRVLKMHQQEDGYFELEVTDIQPGTKYYYKPDQESDYPDPASYLQPEGVHGPSAVVDHSAYTWHDQSWRGLPIQHLILYELHVGTFTPEGTFEAIIPRLPALAETGINALELMPVAQFPGSRNWGYDGVYPYAVQHSYGGPEGLKELVDACHQQGIAVFLDVVYNHLGPEGNYFSVYGPYFTDKYKTPWGEALNYDGPWSDGVRDYFSNNPLYFFEHYHLDGLRLDAIHAVFDAGAVNFWELTNRKVQALQQRVGRPLYMVAESDLNSPRVIQSPDLNGCGFTAQWLDEFHHALYVLLDPEGKPFYEDFGRMAQLAKAYTDGFVLSGEYVKFRKRRHGASSANIPGDKFVAFTQNHDLVGNRLNGERLSVLVSFSRQKLAGAALLLAPYIPLLFMGEDYGEEAPFLYFVSHSDAKLVKAVQDGRKEEFAAFKGLGNPPDPQSPETFSRSKLHWHLRDAGKHKVLLHWYQTLIGLRRTEPILQNFDKTNVRVQQLGEAGFILQRQSPDGRKHLYCCFNLAQKAVSYTLPGWVGTWHKVLDSQEAAWQEKSTKIKTHLPDALKGGETISLAGASITVYKGTLR